MKRDPQLDNITDTSNKFAVGVDSAGDLVILMRDSLATLTKADAVVLAAWLLVLTDCREDQLQRVAGEIRVGLE